MYGRCIYICQPTGGRCALWQCQAHKLVHGDHELVKSMTGIGLGCVCVVPRVMVI